MRMMIGVICVIGLISMFGCDKEIKEAGRPTAMPAPMLMPASPAQPALNS